MKQPELGKKITELRKAKGMTQEELVELCNISVRTIQRIETGETNPRSYTVKTILSALEANFEELGSGDSISKKQAVTLKSAWLAGILYFILGFPEGIMDYTRMMYASEIPESVVSGFFPVIEFGTLFYVSVKALVLIAFIIFMRGFVTTGIIAKNTLLVIVSRILIGLMVFIIIYDIISLFYETADSILVQAFIAMAIGALSILFGIALIKLRSFLGWICLTAGILEILAGLFFLFLNPIGLPISLLAVVFETIAIFQISKLPITGAVNVVAD